MYRIGSIQISISLYLFVLGAECVIRVLPPMLCGVLGIALSMSLCLRGLVILRIPLRRIVVSL